jgi:peptidoglycan hydrolase-like protein with peptidoglycan-binding domain
MNIIWLAMKLLQNRDKLAKIKELFPGLDQDQPSKSQYPVGSVKWLQESINILTGAQLEIDGDYGPKTKDAVADYQTANNLKVDGWAGPETVNSVVEALAKRS